MTCAVSTTSLGLLLPLWLSVAVPATAADTAADDLARMQGDWMVGGMWSQGIKVPDEEAQSLFRSVAGNKYTIARYSKKSSSGTFKLDAAANPNTIDSTPDGPADKAVTIQGIYEFDGDVLRIANALPGKPRPSNFKPKVGQTVIEWQLEAK